MQTIKSIAATVLAAACASTASAAIIPSWRVNTISPAAIAASPQLANAVSVSLMVELTNGSLFNAAGLDLAPLLFGVTFYNQSVFGSDTAPNPLLFPIFPDLEFDSYVGTTTSQAPAVPGKLNGTGAAQVGTGGQFNVAWGATPNTGGSGPREIARITVDYLPPFVFIPMMNGLVIDSLNPNTFVPLPPIIIPEPACVAALGLAVVLKRRSRR